MLVNAFTHFVSRNLVNYNFFPIDKSQILVFVETKLLVH